MSWLGNWIRAWQGVWNGPVGDSAGHTLVAESGSYTITGGASALRVGRRLAADSGSYGITGNAATLTYVPIAPPTPSPTMMFSGGARSQLFNKNNPLLMDRLHKQDEELLWLATKATIALILEESMWET